MSLPQKVGDAGLPTDLILTIIADVNSSKGVNMLIELKISTILS